MPLGVEGSRPAKFLSHKYVCFDAGAEVSSRYVAQVGNLPYRRLVIGIGWLAGNLTAFLRRLLSDLPLG